MEIYNLFPTCVVGFDFTSYPHVSNLLKLISTTTPNNYPIVNKGVTTFKDNEDFLKHNSLTDLRNNFQKALDDYSELTKIPSLKIFNSWFNIMENEGKTYRHNHRGSVVSGAYYPLLEENTCNLIFHSPLHLILSNFSNTSPSPYNSSQYTQPLKPGYLYLFPSWLEHETEVNTGGKRVVISFNTKTT